MTLPCWMLLSLLSAVAQPAAPEVSITEPSHLEPVFGSLTVGVSVFGEVDEVVLFVDDRPMGRKTEPPWRFLVDVGQENREREFRVVARGPGGEGVSRINTPPIKIDDEVAVELQQLYVTVTRGPRRVLDLTEGDFQVFDDGRAQELVTFSRGEVPLAATLLIDSSMSMKGERLTSALRGARAFAEGLEDLDQAMLMLFSDQLMRSTEFTHDPAVLLDPLAGVEAAGNTSINDHLYLALKLLESRQGRRVIVLFTDGADLHSVLDMEEVLWKARRSQALVYWIRLEAGAGSNTSFATAWRNAEGNRSQLENLERTVDQSGGRTLTIDQLSAIEPAFRDILSELREQYVLGYYPSTINNDGGWHEVEVRVGSGLEVRTRDGYVDF
ncbi:MAG: VWA domain-containing protein [Acidobacteriota bacterium]